MEVAGVVLGVVPLLISVLEHYDDVLKIVEEYRHYSSKVRAQCDELSTESTIFRAECVLLLAGSIDRAQAEQMLRDASHPSWRDNTLVQRIDQSFGSLGQMLKVVTGAIESNLAQTTSQLRKAYESSDSGASQRLDPAGQKWRSSIKKRIKFALASHTSIQDGLDQIAKLNERFILLCSQVRKLEMAWEDPSGSSSFVDTQDKHRFDQCITIREIFIDLYDVLRRGCPPDHSHVIRLGLDIKTNADHSNGSVVWSSLRHGDIDVNGGVLPSRAPSSDKSSSNSNEFELKIASQTLQPQGVKQEAHIATEFAIDNTASIVQNSSTSTSNNVPTDVSALVRGAHLCDQMNHSEHAFVGSCPVKSILLQGRKDYKHSVEVRRLDPESSATTSLAQILLQIKSQGQHYEMPCCRRLGIAEYLGLRLLELYETPWMAFHLTSTNLYFFGELGDIADMTQFGYTDIDPDSLYVDVELGRRGKGGSVGLSRTTQPNALQRYPSRFGLATGPENVWLYSFGIILLELAYQIPFAELRAELEAEFAAMGLPLSANPQTAEYQIACQLAEHVGRSLGASFANIVRKCLRCSFDVSSSSLSNAQLRWAVYRDVICELRKLRSNL